MRTLTDIELNQCFGGDMEIVITFHEIDAYCGVQRIYAEGTLYSMRLICD